MITHEEAKILIGFVQNDEYVLPRYNIKKLFEYITQQEKKDKLLKLYKTIATEPYEVDYSVYWKQIKALEEELK